MADFVQVYFLSEEAAEELVDRATSLGYLKHGQDNRRGLSKYVATLAQRQYVDRRPAYIREDDRDRLKGGRLPEWRDAFFQRMPLRLKLDDATINRLLEISEEFGITNHVRRDSARSPTSRIGCVLEAIGLGWLRSAN